MKVRRILKVGRITKIGRSMKVRPIALAVLAGIGWAGAAAAAPAVWTDPKKNFSLAKPSEWGAPDLGSTADAPLDAYVMGTANEECWAISIPRPETAAISPAALVKAWSVPFDAAQWSSIAAPQRLLGGVAAVKESAVDTSGAFPVQTALLKGKERDVVAALHVRPGREVWALCASFDGKDRTAKFNAIVRSVTFTADPPAAP